MPQALSSLARGALLVVKACAVIAFWTVAMLPLTVLGLVMAIGGDERLCAWLDRHLTFVAEPEPLPESTYEQPCASITATLRHEGREFTVVAHYGGRISVGTVLSIWEDGNDSCDCNRCLYIRDQCDPAFPDMGCGETIEMVGDPAFELWDGEILT